MQFLSHVQPYVTLWTAAHQASLSFIISRSLPKLMSTESGMPLNHLMLCCPLFLLPSDFPSISVFSNESALCIMWQKYWSIGPSSEYSGLISFRIAWFDSPAVPGTLKSLIQHHNLQFINSSTLSLLYRPNLISILKKNHSFDYTDLCWQSNVSSSLVARTVKIAGGYLQCGRSEFGPCAGKIPWRRVWQPNLVFLTGEFPWTGEPGGLQSTRSQKARLD